MKKQCNDGEEAKTNTLFRQPNKPEHHKSLKKK